MSKVVESISNLNFVKVKFILKVNDLLTLPAFKGSVFRGMIMRQFKKNFCPLRVPDCENCNVKNMCLYFFIFETENLDTAPFYLENVKKTPHPFIIEPPETEKQEFNEGEELELGLILIGKFSKFLPHFVFVINELGEKGIPYRGKFKLKSVKAMQENANWKEIYDPGRKTLEKKLPIINVSKLEYTKSDPLRVCFKTPTRIQKAGKLISEITAKLIFENLYRRLLALTTSFCEGKLTEDTQLEIDAKILSSNIVWKDWERISNRQKSKMKLGGFVGDVVLENLNNELLFLLNVGSHLHIGKNTAFGLGRYEILKV